MDVLLFIYSITVSTLIIILNKTDAQTSFMMNNDLIMKNFVHKSLFIGR